MLTVSEGGTSIPVSTNGESAQTNGDALAADVLLPEGSPPSSIQERLRTQIEGWRRRLLDLGNRNALIKCSFDRSRGVVEVVHPSCEAVWKRLIADSEAGSVSMRLPWRRDLVPPPADWNSKVVPEPAAATDSKEKPKEREWDPPLSDCLASRRLKEIDLVTEFTDKALDRRLRTLSGYASLSLSEQGVHCLYMVFGFLKWYESIDSEEPLFSPLMLVPVSLSRRSADAPWEVFEAEDDAIDNRCLRERLRQDFKLVLPELPDIDQLEAEQARLEYLAAVRKAISGNDRWEVVDRCVIGRFAFPKVAMWQDLGDHAGSVLSHLLCRSIGGDAAVDPGSVFGAPDGLPEARELDDQIPPGEIKAILDCDSSQMEAVVAARRGVSFVLDGPPGTGKSQTIANIIADALAEGRKVLFVSEKVSALEVVKRRLDDAGLGDFCLECHSSKANRKAILEELKWCLDLPAEEYKDSTPKLKEAYERRKTLNHYVRSIHQPRDPLDLSPFELFGRVSHLDRLGLSTKTRCSLPKVADVDPATLERWMDLFVQAKVHAPVIARYQKHPWRGCLVTARTLSLTDDLRHHLGFLGQVFREISSAMRPLVEQALLPFAVTPGRMGDASKLLKEALSVPEVPESWFRDPKRISSAVLQRLQADNDILAGREQLGSYVDDVVQHVPVEVAVALEDERWAALGRMISDSVPSNVREQHSFLQHTRDVVAELEAASGDLKSSLTELLQSLGLTLRAPLSTSSLPVFAKLARSIGELLPFRREWFDRERWTPLRSACTETMNRIGRLKELEAATSEAVPVDRFTQLGRLAIDLPTLTQQWHAVRPLCSGGTGSDLKALLAQLESLEGNFRRVDSGTTALLNALGIAAPVSLSLAHVKSLVAVAEQCCAAGQIHGGWQDAGMAARIRAVCDEASSDLAEATELREQLSERLSHRAFRPAAASIAARGTEFNSAWRRLIGGFGQLRTDAADLFKSGTPKTKQFLADLARLRRYHERLNECREAAEELAPHLPSNHPADDAQAWSRLRLSVDATQALATAVPLAAKELPATVTAIDRPTGERSLADLKNSIAALESIVPSSLSLDWSRPVPELVERIRSLYEAVAVCRDTNAQVMACIGKDVPIDTWMDEYPIAQEYASNVAAVEKLFAQCAAEMPRGATPLDEATWLTTRSGTNVAEKVLSFVSSAEPLTTAYSTEGAIDLMSLQKATDSLETSLQRFNLAFRQSQDAIQSTGPTPDEQLRRPIDELIPTVSGTRLQLEDRLSKLAAMASQFRDCVDVEVQQVIEDAKVIGDVRDAKRRRSAADELLESAEAADPGKLEGGGFDAAEWLANASVTPLTRATATDSATRQLVKAASEVLRQAGSPEFATSWKFLRTLFDVKANVSSGFVPFEVPLDELAEHFAMLVDQAPLLDDWIKFSRWQKEMAVAGFGEVVNDLLTAKYTAAETPQVVSARFYRQVFDHLAEHDPLLSEFDLDEHDRLRERFRELDQWEVRAAATQIRQYQLGRADRPRPGWNIPATSELGILQKEIQKKRRHLPLRKLFAEIPGVLQRLKPCIMMSPLSVSTFLQTENVRFDLVIFDEASQVFPWDAIGAIYRGTQLIVAGDEQQLPPTDFFNRSEGDDDEEEEERDAIGDFGSILSVCKSINMPSKRLRWHYRSRREPLITFSNRHFYDGELVTFPSTRDASHDAVTLDSVPNGKWMDRKNLPEAERIADLIIEHHRKSRHMSLGVIAFNSTQQRAIEDCLFERRKKEPEIDALLAGGLPEPLFIKNLENVQGDERDVILLSMGYARNEAGTFSKNFGPLSKKGGHRRLNVAVTRAREQLIFVASVRAADMDLAPSMSQGAHLLKAYLEYAERGVDSLALETAMVAGSAESPFEAEVAAALIERGLSPVPQVGTGGFRIDLALKHPKWPGRFCLGVECDGATYHSSHTARDRDRIRQSVLEQLGWRIVRVWSTDWVRNPLRQVQRILAAYEDASIVDEWPLPEPVTESIVEADADLEPRIVKQNQQQVRTFNHIDDASDEHIRSVIRGIVSTAGATCEDDLLRLTARQLGFGRTGRKIRERVETALQSEIQKGTLIRAGDRVAMAAN